MPEPIKQAVSNEGVALLPIPTGATLVTCSACHAGVLADHGQLIHHPDGSHTWRPAWGDIPVASPTTTTQVTGR